MKKTSILNFYRFFGICSQLFGYNLKTEENFKKNATKQHLRLHTLLQSFSTCTFIKIGYILLSKMLPKEKKKDTIVKSLYYELWAKNLKKFNGDISPHPYSRLTVTDSGYNYNLYFTTTYVRVEIRVRTSYSYVVSIFTN